MSSFVISQILVAVAIAFDIASFQFKNREKLLACFMASSALLSIHFFVLDQNIGAALYLLTFLRFFTAFFSKSTIWLFVFLPASIAAFLFTYQSAISFLALFGALASTFGAFQRDDLRVRILMLVGTISWLAFNLVIFSPLAVVRQSLFAISNLVGLWRFYGRPNK